MTNIDIVIAVAAGALCYVKVVRDKGQCRLRALDVKGILGLNVLRAVTGKGKTLEVFDA